jgi:hypothetical protein
MLDVASVASSSSFSSRESTSSESIKASSLPIPDLVIPSELPDISEMLEFDVAQLTMEPGETGPHGGSSACMLLDMLQICIAGFTNFDIVGTSAGDGNDADAALNQTTQGLSLTKVMDEDGGQIIDYLEHVSCYGYFFNIPQPLSQLLICFSSGRLSL